MLQLTNYQYKQLIESNNSSKIRGREQVIEGILDVGKYEGKELSIDIAEIFRRLKRKIGR